MNTKIIFILALIFILCLLNIKKNEYFNQNNIILITQFYKPKWNLRYQEIRKCLLKNLNNKYISKIYLFCEEKFDFQEIFRNDKVDLSKLVQLKSKRLSFKKVFNFSNKFNNDIKILANSDIYFDESIKKLYKLDFNKLFLSLTRFNLKDSKFVLQHNPKHSQDTWIWKDNLSIGKFKDYDKDGIKLGIWGCDNRINYIVKKSGYNVKNYCKDIMTYHLHKENLQRNDVKKLQIYKKPYYLPSVEYIN